MNINRDREKSNNSSQALKAGGWYVISSIVVKSVAFLSIPIFTRLMTTEEFGVVATFVSWCGILSTFTSLNLSYSIGRAKLDFPGLLNTYVGSMQTLSLLFTGLLSFVGLIFIYETSAFFNMSIPFTVLLLLYLLFTPIINFVQNKYRYEYKYKQNIVIAWFVSFGTVALSLILILIVPGDKAFLRVLGMVIPNIILSLYLWSISLKTKSISFNKNYWKYGLTLSVPLVIHTVCMNLLGQSDRIFISSICGDSETGIYSLVYSYGLILSVVTSAIADGWLPWFHDNYYVGRYELINDYSRKLVILGCGLGLFSILLAPEAIVILGGYDYLEGLVCVPPIVLGVVCQYIYTHYVNIELHLKKTKFVSLGTSLAAIINIMLNYFFIPVFGFSAAAFTTLFSYLVLMILHFLITRLVLKIKLYNDWFMFGSLACTCFLSYFITLSYSYNAIRYIIIGVDIISMTIIFRDYIERLIEKMKIRF